MFYKIILLALFTIVTQNVFAEELGLEIPATAKVCMSHLYIGDSSFAFYYSCDGSEEKEKRIYSKKPVIDYPAMISYETKLIKEFLNAGMELKTCTLGSRPATKRVPDHFCIFIRN